MTNNDQNKEKYKTNVNKYKKLSISLIIGKLQLNLQWHLSHQNIGKDYHKLHWQGCGNFPHMYHSCILPL